MPPIATRKGCTTGEFGVVVKDGKMTVFCHPNSETDRDADLVVKTIEALHEECEEYVETMNRMRDILNRTALALKGPEAPLTMHSWHDLPELAAALKPTGRD